MYGFIDNTDFINLESEKYWTFSKTYKGDARAETEYMIKSGQYCGARKQDGHYARFIKDMDGNMRLQGRTESVNGGYLNKIEWVPQCQEFFNSLPNGTCLLGELYFPNSPGSRKVTTILGCLKDKALQRQEAGEKLHYYIFDIWAYGGKSFLNKSIEDRIETLNSICGAAATYNCVEFAQYLEGEALWEELGHILSSGGEGIVITKKGSKPEPGKRTARKTLKVKQEIENTIDAFLTGKYKPATKNYSGRELPSWNLWSNVKTGEKFNESKYEDYCNGAPVEPITKAYYYGWASSVQFGVYNSKGEIVPIGWISGITDELKRDIVIKNEELKGRVAEITCMQIEHIDGNYSLRHAKIKTWRDNKKPEDCEFSQISNE